MPVNQASGHERGVAAEQISNVSGDADRYAPTRRAGDRQAGADPITPGFPRHMLDSA